MDEVGAGIACGDFLWESVLPTPSLLQPVMLRLERRWIAGEAAYSKIICAILSPFEMLNFF